MTTRTGERIVTVVGGSGFIGRYVVQRFARAGAVVRVATRHPASAQFLKPMGDVGQVTPILTNIRNAESLARAVAGADVVVNLVGILHEGGKQRFQAVQADGPAALGRAAAAAGVSRLVHVSAIGADANGAASYARTKALGEQGLRAAFPAATVLRPSVVFGPEDNFFNMFAALARLPMPLPLIGGGGTRFQPVYVGDVADAVVACVADPATAGQTYELGGPQVYTFRQLLEVMLKEIDRKRPLVSVPFALARLQATFLELLPKPLLTRDQVRLLERDNVVGAGALGFKELGMTPTPLEAILPTYLWRFRAGGRWHFKTTGSGRAA